MVRKNLNIPVISGTTCRVGESGSYRPWIAFSLKLVGICIRVTRYMECSIYSEKTAIRQNYNDTIRRFISTKNSVYQYP